ncbi:MAG: hypothetical protein HY302_03830 [Opitutae bacterium]|nr:hypothetical protein [Opitutae bacterium]
MLSTESPPARRWIMLVAILGLGLTAFAHTWLADRHLTFVSAVQRGDHPIHTPLQRIRPGFTADGSMWIRHALDLLEGTEAPRSHHTALDNPPAGRAVHWNSALTWWIAGCGWTYHQLSGTPLPAAVERAAVWANLPLLLAFLAGFGWWAARRAGALAGVLVAAAILGHRSLSEGFMPAYPDHHGLIAMSVLGLTLGVLFMGGGWRRGNSPAPGLALLPAHEKSARAAAAWSGFWGGFGLWISTASLALPLALIPLAAGLATFLCRRDLAAAGAVFSPGVWRTWGRVGALTSLGFYLLEYFPLHLGWRLEVNHPLYALAWWAGAELTAALLEFLAALPGKNWGRVAPGADEQPERGEGAASPVASQQIPPRRSLLFTAAWTLPLLLAPALVILWRGAEVFLPLDPFVARSHESIVEFLPFLLRLRADGVLNHFEYVFLYPLLYLAALALLIRNWINARASRHKAAPTVQTSQHAGAAEAGAMTDKKAAPIVSPENFLLLLLLGPALALAALGLWQSRWGLLAGGVEGPLLLVILFAASAHPRLGATALRRWALGALAAAVLFLPGTSLVFHTLREQIKGNVVPSDETLELVYREIAQAVRESQPSGPVVLFSNPNASLSIGYYGRFQTLGTLYWENRDGLRAAAELNSAPTEEAAAALIRRLGVTHLALVTHENFLLEYARLLNPQITPPEVEATFGYRLLGKKIIPEWLEPLLYRAPRDLPGKLAGLEVYLFKVNFAQTRAAALYRIGQLLALQENSAAALDAFARAAALDEQDAAPWLRRGEILLRQKLWRDAAADFARGIALAPGRERYRLDTQAGIAFEQAGETATAIGFYRRAIGEDQTNGIALNNLAWLLATAKDDSLRDAPLALSLAQAAELSETDVAGNLDTLAAALANSGRFAEAVLAAERALALAQKTKDQALIKGIQEHLAAYRAGQPWRQ